MVDTGRTPESLAAEMGVSVHGVEKWMRGERMPRPKHANKIKELSFGAVTPNDFHGISEGALK